MGVSRLVSVQLVYTFVVADIYYFYYFVAILLRF